MYNTCGEKHQTDYKETKKNKDADCGNSQNSDSTLACATTKLKSKVVSMSVVAVKVKCSNSKKEFRTHTMLIAAVREPSLVQTWAGS